MYSVHVLFEYNVYIAASRAESYLQLLTVWGLGAGVVAFPSQTIEYSAAWLLSQQFCVLTIGLPLHPCYTEVEVFLDKRVRETRQTAGRTRVTAQQKSARFHGPFYP